MPNFHLHQQKIYWYLVFSFSFWFQFTIEQKLRKSWHIRQNHEGIYQSSPFSYLLINSKIPNKHAGWVTFLICQIKLLSRHLRLKSRNYYNKYQNSDVYQNMDFVRSYVDTNEPLISWTLFSSFFPDQVRGSFVPK